uniref:Uncharacterized protein n=1 Tax=Manihot esculenta TaxID=3983 RepID=A0A2C9V6L0_MANES
MYIFSKHSRTALVIPLPLTTVSISLQLSIKQLLILVILLRPKSDKFKNLLHPISSSTLTSASTTSGTERLPSPFAYFTCQKILPS